MSKNKERFVAWLITTVIGGSFGTLILFFDHSLNGRDTASFLIGYPILLGLALLLVVGIEKGMKWFGEK